MSGGIQLEDRAKGVFTEVTDGTSQSADTVASVEELAELLREAFVRLQPSAEEISQAWAAAQVTMQQLRVMTILYHEGSTRVSDLATRLAVSTPTVTGILDRLVRQRLSFRLSDPRDRRVVLNKLSPEGRDLVERLLPAHGDHAEAALRRLTPDERQDLIASLRPLLRVVPRH